MRLIRSGLVRYAALALALVASGGQALSGLHFALVPHVTCAEHGELIESPSVSAQPIAPSDGHSITSAADQGRAHEHCAIALLRRQKAQPSAGLEAPKHSSLALHLLRSGRRATPPAPIALLAFAPKSSPPV